MRAIAILAATAAMVTLAGCDRLRGGGSANGSANAATNGAASNSAAQQGADAGGKPAEGGGVNNGGALPASSSGVQVDRTFVLGRWTDDGDCGPDAPAAVEFTQDGRFIASNGTEGLWILDGDRLTMTGSRTAIVRIVPVDQDTMTVVNEDGSLARSTRC